MKLLLKPTAPLTMSVKLVVPEGTCSHKEKSMHLLAHFWQRVKQSCTHLHTNSVGYALMQLVLNFMLGKIQTKAVVKRLYNINGIRVLIKQEARNTLVIVNASIPAHLFWQYATLTAPNVLLYRNSGRQGLSTHTHTQHTQHTQHKRLETSTERSARDRAIRAATALCWRAYLDQLVCVFLVNGQSL